MKTKLLAIIHGPKKRLFLIVTAISLTTLVVGVIVVAFLIGTNRLFSTQNQSNTYGDDATSGYDYLSATLPTDWKLREIHGDDGVIAAGEGYFGLTGFEIFDPTGQKVFSFNGFPDNFGYGGKCQTIYKFADTSNDYIAARATPNSTVTDFTATVYEQFSLFGISHRVIGTDIFPNASDITGVFNPSCSIPGLAQYTDDGPKFFYWGSLERNNYVSKLEMNDLPESQRNIIYTILETIKLVHPIISTLPEVTDKSPTNTSPIYPVRSATESSGNPLTTYLDSQQVFAIQYPSNWAVSNEYESGKFGRTKAYGNAAQKFNFISTTKIRLDRGETLEFWIKQNLGEEFKVFEPTEISGQSAYKVVQLTQAQARKIYLVSSPVADTAILFAFLEWENSTGENRDFSQYAEDFEQLVRSVRFGGTTPISYPSSNLPTLEVIESRDHSYTDKLLSAENKRPTLYFLTNDYDDTLIPIASAVTFAPNSGWRATPVSSDYIWRGTFNIGTANIAYVNRDYIAFIENDITGEERRLAGYYNVQTKKFNYLIDGYPDQESIYNIYSKSQNSFSYLFVPWNTPLTMSGFPKDYTFTERTLALPSLSYQDSKIALDINKLNKPGQEIQRMSVIKQLSGIPYLQIFHQYAYSDTTESLFSFLDNDVRKVSEGEHFYQTVDQFSPQFRFSQQSSADLTGSQKRFTILKKSDNTVVSTITIPEMHKPIFLKETTKAIYVGQKYESPVTSPDYDNAITKIFRVDLITGEVKESNSVTFEEAMSGGSRYLIPSVYYNLPPTQNH